MTLLAGHTALAKSARALRYELLLLRATVVRDRPLEDDSVLVDLYADGTDDLLEQAGKMLSAAEAGLEAARQQAGSERAPRALIRCQEAFNDLALKFSFNLYAHDRLSDLESLGREQGAGWRRWTDEVHAALEHCQRAIYDVNEALFVCWQEHIEQRGALSVSVQATGIGPQIKAPAWNGT